MVQTSPYGLERDAVDEILAAMEDILTSGQLTLGRRVSEFEETASKIMRIPASVAVSSGTAALQIVLEFLQVRNRTVIVPTNTFAATATATLRAGAALRYVDCDERLQPSVDHIEATLTSDVAAIVIAHIGGYLSSQLEHLVQLSTRTGIPLIEDAAHAHGATLNGKAAGTFGYAGTFSFYPTKVATSGEGGLVTSADTKLLRWAMVLRDQGKPSFNSDEQVEIGANWRLSEPHAAIGLASLRRLNRNLDVRRGVAAEYDQTLEGTDGVRPVLPGPGERPNYYKYVVIVDDELDSDRLKRICKENRVQLSGSVYRVPCHRQPALRNAVTGEYLPNAERYCPNHICLAVHPHLSLDDARENAERFREAVAQCV